MIGLLAAPLAVAAEMQSFWDLKPQQLRVLVAAPQVMVTRTASGLDAYCRCPVVLKPHEIPEAMKKAIIAVEDKRFMDHGGIDLIALGSVLRGGLSRGGTCSANWSAKGPRFGTPGHSMARSANRNCSPLTSIRSSSVDAKSSACIEPADTT